MRTQEMQSYGLSQADVGRFSHLKEKWRVDGSHDQLRETKSLAQYISDFDENWQQEGLPKDWYNLNKRVGFSMDTQMALLKGTDAASVTLWAAQSRRDALGFCLEYLSGKLVYPFLYEQDLMAMEYVDPKYKKSLLAGVSEKERHGQVKQSLAQIQAFFLDPRTPDGSIAFMASPKGETGLTTDDGKRIRYPDSHFFLFVKDGLQIKGVTIKTDFSLSECREVIQKLTGTSLAEDAPVEDYVAAIALMKPWDNPWEKGQVSIFEDLLPVLQNARPAEKRNYAFEDKQWKEVVQDIHHGQALYNFTDEAQNMLDEFEQHVTSKQLIPLELRKAIGATMLRLSKLFLFDEDVDRRHTTESNTSDDPIERERRYRAREKVTYGNVLLKMEDLPGCAGGGQKNKDSLIVQSVNLRKGEIDTQEKDVEDDPALCRCNSQKAHFHCPGKDGKECKHPIIVKQGISSCPKCGAGKVC